MEASLAVAPMACCSSPLSPGRRSSHCGAPAPEAAEVLCAGTLTQVLSWLGVADLADGAGLVCKRWDTSSQCTEIWRG